MKLSEKMKSGGSQGRPDITWSVSRVNATIDIWLKEVAKLEAENERLRESWGKRSAKPRRLRATARHYLLALDTGDETKRREEEKKLRQYSGYAGWPRAPQETTNDTDTP